MKRLFTILLILLTSSVAMAGDVFVSGYFTSDGRYVPPHIRSAPDGKKWNNYGPATNRSQLMNPYSRDWDRDGISNRFDFDDDNDGLFDDYDPSQYGE